MSSERPRAAACDRYPCDTAYRRGTHTPNVAGTIVHEIRTLGDGGLDGGWWDVSVIAFDDDPWQVAVRVGAEGSGELTVIPPMDLQGVRRTRDSERDHSRSALESVGRLTSALVQAIIWAASAEVQGL